MSIPTITGPIAPGSRPNVFGGSARDLASHGYVEEEYFVEGRARRYAVADTPPDGRFVAEPVDEAPYRTRVVVRRPIDPAAFNGTLIVNWTNVSAGWEVIGDAAGVTDGYAYLAVSTQRAGIEGFAGMPFGLRSWDPERYDALHVPGDAYSFDIFSQAALAVGEGGRRAGGPDPLGGLHVRHRIATGGSQSASRLVSYMNVAQNRDRVFDGFVPTVDFGAYAEFDDRIHDEGDVVSYTPEGFAKARIPLARKRPDLEAKVLVVNSESEARIWQVVEQADDDRHRVWFVAGGAHAGGGDSASTMMILARDGMPSLPAPEAPPSMVVFAPVVDAALHAMHRWLETGVAPASQPRFEFDTDGTHLARDEDGIVRGGIRLPEVAVPLAVNAGEGSEMTGFAALAGTSSPLPEERIRELYDSREDYVQKVRDVATRLVGDGTLLARDADRYIVAAEAQPIPVGG
jgi:hypothetical protein